MLGTGVLFVFFRFSRVLVWWVDIDGGAWGCLMLVGLPRVCAETHPSWMWRQSQRESPAISSWSSWSSGCRKNATVGCPKIEHVVRNCIE
jgi:hypothetical protein